MSHLDNSPLLNLSNLSAALLRLGEKMELLLAAWWMRLKFVVSNFDDLQQILSFHSQSLLKLSNRNVHCLQSQSPLQAVEVKLLLLLS